jgi:two-component system response regulator HydG
MPHPSSFEPPADIQWAGGGLLRILWIDDEPDETLSVLLRDHGCQVEWATTGAAGLERARSGQYDAIIVDVRLGDMSGLTVLRRLTVSALCPPVLMVTGCYCEEEVLRDAWRFGAAAMAYKPLVEDAALAEALRVVAVGQGESPLLHVRPEASGVRRAAHAGTIDPGQADLYDSNVVAVSPAMRAIVERIAHVAPTDGTILLTGETGVGKEMVARAIHRSSRRCDRPIVTLNCSAIPQELLESELFGHRKGAFTGAASDQAGVVEHAHGGTLFLDEIADLARPAQGHLLRFLETGEARRLGDQKPTWFDVRIIAATNRPLAADLKRGRLRQDLYFRLAVLHLHIPPLRERREDIDALVAWWLQHLAERHHRRPLGIDQEALDVLREHDWPGNVRELRNVLERAVCLATGNRLTVIDATAALAPASPNGTPTARRRADLDATLKALHEHAGHRRETARALRIDRTTLWRRLRRYGFGRSGDAT